MAAKRHQITSEIGEYSYYHLSTVVTGVPVVADPSGAFATNQGSYLGSLITNQAGTGVTITLYDGNPSGSGKTIAIIKPTANGDPTRVFDIVCDNGLYVTSAGTMGDFTITFRDQVPGV